MKFIKFTLIWISQQLAIPFWIVGHIHLSINRFHELYYLKFHIGHENYVLINEYVPLSKKE
jgi:hypothetical protein